MHWKCSFFGIIIIHFLVRLVSTTVLCCQSADDGCVSCVVALTVVHSSVDDIG